MCRAPGTLPVGHGVVLLDLAGEGTPLSPSRQPPDRATTAAPGFRGT
jgi:hypothetical protein